MAGDSPEKASEEAAAVMKIETALAKGATSRVELRNPENRYHIYTIKQLEDLAPNFDFATQSFTSATEPLYNGPTYDVAPRLGLSYDPFGKGKTAVRAGFGTYYSLIDALSSLMTNACLPSGWNAK